jgi:hypothetical protein
MAPQLCDIAGSSDRLCLAVAIFVGMMRQGQDGQPAHANKQEAEHKCDDKQDAFVVDYVAGDVRAGDSNRDYGCSDERGSSQSQAGNEFGKCDGTVLTAEPAVSRRRKTSRSNVPAHGEA